MAWDEAREVLVVVLTVCAAAMALAPIAVRLIDGQFDRDGVVSMTVGAQPVTGIILLGAAVLIATTPAHDVVPALRHAVRLVAWIVVLLGAIAILDILFSPAAGGVRQFFTRFTTILRFSGPATLMAATAAWTARRVEPFPPL